MSTTRVTVAIADLVSLASGPGGPSVRAWDSAETSDRVAAARAGDREAFGRLVELHEAAALRTAMAALGRREDAQDAVQDAFVLAWRRLAGFRGDASFRTWLLAIVWRQALDRRKARHRWWRRNAAFPADGVEGRSAAAGDASPEEQVLLDERRARIADAIHALPPKLRDALLLAASGEYTYDEISEIQGVRTGTVKWRVFEARRLVRARIERSRGR